jgi:hypothetical protein
MFRVIARRNTKKEEDERSNQSYKSVPKDKKLKAYKSNLGPTTMKNLRMISKNIGKQSMNTSRSSMVVKKIKSKSTLRNRSAKKNKIYLQKQQKPPLKKKD